MPQRNGPWSQVFRQFPALVITALLVAACLGCGTRKGTAEETSAPAGVAALPQPAPTDAVASPVPDASQTQTPIYRVDPIRADVVNILLIGTDSRKTAGSVVGGNADTVILASFDRTNNRVKLVSFMRDAVVILGDKYGEFGKLKKAYTDGGVGMLINTINSSFELDIQRYAAVGLDGFVTLIDETLGGLDIELSQSEIDFINDRIASYENEAGFVKNCPPVVAEPGLVHLNGIQTLLFVRNRTVPLSDTAAGQATDYDRAARQREVLTLVYQKLVNTAPITAVPGLVTFALRHVQTNLTAEELYSLGEQLLAEDVQLESLSVPFPGTWEYGGDGSGILFDRNATAPRLLGILYENENENENENEFQETEENPS